jgi:hypothetical protein
MNGVHVCNLSGTDDSIGAQIAVRTTGSSDANRFVSKLDVKGLNIGLRINSEGFDAHLAAGSDDAKRDFTAIGDENLLNHDK